ncbi:MAG: M23 family peptidase, partial [Sulfurovum sp.]
MGNRKGKTGGSKIVIIVVMLALLAGAGYVYTAPEFEKEAPVIQSEKDIFWNRIDPLNIPVSDNVALSHYQISLGDGTKSVVVAEGDFKEGSKEKILLVNYPKNNIFDKKSNQLQAKVSVTDSSMWNFFRGNTAEKTIHIKVDHKRPNVNVLANSYSITQGG